MTQNEYTKYGKFHSSTLFRRLGKGSWLKVLEIANLQKTRNYGISEESFFENIQLVWEKLGRQPYPSDMKKPLSKYSVDAYKYRFGTWRKALEKFIKWVNHGEPSLIKESAMPTIKENGLTEKSVVKPKTKREPSWRLRHLVMRRDNFTCKHCGWSPAKRPDPKLELHIDHIIPYPKGETVLENLQTLCSTCNIGKSNLEI